jgi:ribonucleoside-diphosphate reductase alpha chain
MRSELKEFTRYEDVKDMTTSEYFNGNKFSIDGFGKKYRQSEDDSYVHRMWRVCQYIAQAEPTQELAEYWANRWFNEIFHDWWQPAGSEVSGADKDANISMANCTTINMGSIDQKNNWDNLESIFRNTAYKVGKTAAYRQGLGVDFGAIRPKETTVNNSAQESSGVIHWMRFIDNIGYFVGQKGRIPAMLFSLPISHPDVKDFIKVKTDFTLIQNANISVHISDAFMQAVHNNEQWKLKFTIPAQKKGERVYVDEYSADPIDSYKDKDGNYYYLAKRDKEEEVIEKTENARELLELIAKYMKDNAEPGVQFITTAQRYSNSDAVYDPEDEYDSRIVSTNACSEQYLSAESLCVLASINMGKFSTDRDEWKEELANCAYSINRFLDDVNEMELRDNKYATPTQRIAIQKLRRTGAGITNLAEWIFKQGYNYADPDSNDQVEEFVKYYNYYLYKSTIELGRERGSFELFDPEKIKKSEHIQRMMQEFPDLEFDAMRNVTVSSIAPTGTLSLMFSRNILSYGIEPPFGLYFWKRTRVSGYYEYYFSVPAVVREFVESQGYDLGMVSDTIKDDWEGTKGKVAAEKINEAIANSNFNFRSSLDITAREKLELMAKINKWVDSSISVTYMLEEDANWQDVYDFIVKAHEKELKSIAAFPDMKLYGIVSFVPFKDLAFKLINEGEQLHPQNFTQEEYKQLPAQGEDTQPETSPASAYPRPKSLPADIYNVKVGDEKFIIAVGKYNDKPFEIFGGKQDKISIDFKKRKEGEINKLKSGVYQLVIHNNEEEDTIINDFAEQFTQVEQRVFRLVSTLLRHGVPIKFITEQLNKVPDIDINSLPFATIRILKKYISDGEQASKKKCPECGNTGLIYEEGCIKCSACDWSQCA